MGSHKGLQEHPKLVTYKMGSTLKRKEVKFFTGGAHNGRTVRLLATKTKNRREATKVIEKLGGRKRILERGTSERGKSRPAHRKKARRRNARAGTKGKDGKKSRLLERHGRKRWYQWEGEKRNGSDVLGRERNGVHRRDGITPCPTEVPKDGKGSLEILTDPGTFLRTGVR